MHGEEESGLRASSLLHQRPREEQRVVAGGRGRGIGGGPVTSWPSRTPSSGKLVCGRAAGGAVCILASCACCAPSRAEPIG